MVQLRVGVSALSMEPLRLLANQANILGLPKQSTLRKDTVFYKIDLYRFEGI